jgi:hypothetical protein
VVDGGTSDRGTTDRGTAIGRLKKADAERLLAAYDTDPIAALTAALRIVLDMPDAGWAALVAAAPIDADRRGRLCHTTCRVSINSLPS